MCSHVHSPGRERDGRDDQSHCSNSFAESLRVGASGAPPACPTGGSGVGSLGLAFLAAGCCAGCCALSGSAASGRRVPAAAAAGAALDSVDATAVGCTVLRAAVPACFTGADAVATLAAGCCTAIGRLPSSMATAALLDEAVRAGASFATPLDATPSLSSGALGLRWALRFLALFPGMVCTSLLAVLLCRGRLVVFFRSLVLPDWRRFLADTRDSFPSPLLTCILWPIA